MALGGRVTNAGRAGGAAPSAGFTLLELMIVIVVLGILAGIVIFKVGTFSQDASRSACGTDIHTLLTANAAYAASHNGDNAPTLQALMDGGYIQSLPKSEVTFANGATTPASAAGCTGELAFTPDPTTTTTAPPTSIRLAHVDWSHADLVLPNWTTTLTVTVRDQDNAAVSGAKVTGSWDDGATLAGCDPTGPDGTCAFTAGHSTALPSTPVTWTLVSVEMGSATDASPATTVTCKRAGGSPCVVTP